MPSPPSSPLKSLNIVIFLCVYLLFKMIILMTWKFLICERFSLRCSTLSSTSSLWTPQFISLSALQITEIFVLAVAELSHKICKEMNIHKTRQKVTTTWMNFEDMLNKRSLSQRTYCMLPFIWNVPNRQIHRDYE